MPAGCNACVAGKFANRYRYGFNGKENDNEIKGEGNQIDYGMRVYDSRLGRFLSVDPLTKQYPHYTPYQFAGNTPIQAIDLDGEEEKYYLLAIDEKTGLTSLTLTKTINYKSYLGVTRKASPMYIVSYPQGGWGSNEYKFTTENGRDIQAPDNTIENFEAWLSTDHSDKFNRPEHVFVSQTGKTLRYINRAAEYAVNNNAVGHINSSPGKSVTNVGTDKQVIAANGGNDEAVSANGNAPITFTYENVNHEVQATTPYSRPANATNRAQRKAVNQPGAACVTCGTKKGPFVADHITPLAVEHLTTGSIDWSKMTSVEAVQSQCPGCSARQGGQLRNITKTVNQEIRNRQNGQQNP